MYLLSISTIKGDIILMIMPNLFVILKVIYFHITVMDYMGRFKRLKDVHVRQSTSLLKAVSSSMDIFAFDYKLHALLSYLISQCLTSERLQVGHKRVIYKRLGHLGDDSDIVGLHYQC